MRMAVLHYGRRVATSSPSPMGRIAVSNAGSAETRAQNSRSTSVPSPGSGRARPGRAAAPQHVVGDDDGARREPVHHCRQVREVLVLQRVDEDHVERPGQRFVGAGKRLEGRCVHDGDSRVRKPGRSPERARPVGSSPVGIDRRDGAARRESEAHPQRRVADGGPDLEDPPSVRREDRQHPPAVATQDRNPFALDGRDLHLQQDRVERPAGRLDPVEVGVGR